MLPDEALRAVLRDCPAPPFAKSEIVFHRGDPADSLDLIVKGRSRGAIATPLGDAATLSVRGPGDAYGELALLGEESARSATVCRPSAPAETHSIYRDDFIQLRREHASVNEVLIRTPRRAHAPALRATHRGVLRTCGPPSPPASA